MSNFAEYTPAIRPPAPSGLGLGLSPFLLGHRVVPLSPGKATAGAGSPTVGSNTSASQLRFSQENTLITYPAETGGFSVDWPLPASVDLRGRHAGMWFFVPAETLVSGLQTNARPVYRVAALYLLAGESVFAVWPGYRYALPGWNYLSSTPADLELVSGSWSDLQAVTAVRLRIQADEAPLTSYSVIADSFVHWDGPTPGRPVALLEFDDAYKAIYDHAFPLMRERGIRGSTHVITSRITDDPDPLFASADELMEMHDAGWDICSHTHTHPYVSQLTDEQVEHELRHSQETLLDLGFRNGPQFYVAPYGDATPHAIAVAQRLYQCYRGTGYRGGQPLVPYHPYGLETISAELPSGALPGGALANRIEQVAETGGFLPIMWHGEIGATWGGKRWEVNEFADLLDLLQGKGFEFVTYSDRFPGTQLIP